MVKNRYWLVALGFCLAISFILYGFSLHGAFVRDDTLFSPRTDLHYAGSLGQVWFQTYIPGIREVGVYRPLTIFTFALNFVVFGSSTVSFHVFNVILNALNIFLVFAILRRLFKEEMVAIFGAAVFAFLPIHTEAVAFIKSRDELLATFFSLLAWLVFIRATKAKEINFKKLWLSAGFFVLAVLGKETLFSAPGVFLAVWWMMDRPKIKDLARVASVYATAGAGYLLLRLSVLHQYAFGNDNGEFVVNQLVGASLAERLVTGCKIAFLMFSKSFVPWNLSSVYNYNQVQVTSNLFGSWQALGGLAMLLGLLALVVMGIRNKAWQWAGVGAAITLISYAMVSKMIFSGGEFAAERWMYFPSIGFALILGWGIAWLYRQKQWLGLAVGGALLLYYGAVTVPRNFAWLNSRTVIDSLLKSAPKAAITYQTQASWYLDHGDPKACEIAAKKALAIYPDYWEAYEMLSRAAFAEGDWAANDRYFTRAYQLAAPYTTIRSRISHAEALLRLKRYKDAIAAAQQVMRLAPTREAYLIIAAGSYKLYGLDVAKHFLGRSGFPVNEEIRQMKELLGEK